MSSIPSELRYSKSHEWVKVEDGVATIGITDHAQEELGDIVFVELPEVGRVLSVDDIFGTVESVKTASDLYSPVSGEVVEVNSELPGAEATINDSPYNSGWMVKIRLRTEDAPLLSADEYRAEIGE